MTHTATIMEHGRPTVLHDVSPKIIGLDGLPPNVPLIHDATLAGAVAHAEELFKSVQVQGVVWRREDAELVKHMDPQRLIEAFNGRGSLNNAKPEFYLIGNVEKDGRDVSFEGLRPEEFLIGQHVEDVRCLSDIFEQVRLHLQVKHKTQFDGHYDDFKKPKTDRDPDPSRRFGGKPIRILRVDSGLTTLFYDTAGKFIVRAPQQPRENLGDEWTYLNGDYLFLKDSVRWGFREGLLHAVPKFDSEESVAAGGDAIRYLQSYTVLDMPAPEGR